MQESMEHTLMNVRRTVTEPKTALAGGKLEIFAGSRAPMAAFNVDIVSSRLLGCWDPAASMLRFGVVGREPYGVKTVRKFSNPNRGERQSFHDAPIQTGPFCGSGKNCIRAAAEIFEDVP